MPVSVPLETVGGLACALRPEDLPEGASPRTYDTDFMTGRWYQRPGLSPVFSYAGATTGPNPGQSAVSASWTDPAAILANGSSYASFAFGSPRSSSSSATSTGSSIGGGAAWANPQNVDSDSAFATVSLAPGGTTYTPTTPFGSATARGTVTVPTDTENAVLSGFTSVSVTSATMNLNVTGTINVGGGSGSVQVQYSINGGLSWVTARTWTSSFTTTAITVPLAGIVNLGLLQCRVVATAVYGSGLAALASITGGDLSVTAGTGGASSSQTLSALVTGLSIPSNATVTGFAIGFNALCTGTTPTFTAQLSVGSETDSFTLTGSSAAYTAGSSSDLWGYGGWTPATLANLSIDFNALSTGTSTVSVNNLSVTVYYSVPVGSNLLTVTEFAFNLPSIVTPTGITVALSGFATSAVTLTVQLVCNGVPIGATKTVPMPTALGILTLGGVADLWEAAISTGIVNNTTFGVQITASSAFPGAQALLNYATIQLSQTTQNANFTYLTTFVANDGTVCNVAFDSTGSLWMENVDTNPGVLTLVMDGITPGSYASSCTSQDGEFLCFNDLMTGSDLPRKFTLSPQTLDRVSQVGPGASPIFAPSSNGAGQPADITSYAVASGVVTLQAVNTFTAGEPVLFAGLTSATFLNGQVLVVLGSGLSGTAFEVAFATGNVSTTADSGTATPQSNYPISTITQPAAQVRTSSYFLQSVGPGSTSPGNVVTVYYSDSTSAPADADLVNAFNSGNPVYLYTSFTGGPATQGPTTAQVTSVGEGSPPGQPRQFFYYTYVVATSAFVYYQGSGNPGYTANYQRTLATLTTAEPVPVLQVGSQATIAGASVPQYDSTWPITQSLNSGSMAITQTTLTAGVATYSYTVVSGANPTAGQLVTITGTLNANGTLNGTDLLIASVSGTNNGTFTVTGFEAVTDYPAEAEEGQATTAGTQFTFDPGADTLGTSTDPIYGSSTGGVLIFTGSGQYIGAGTRQGVVFFITRNGYETCPSPPVTFTCPENTTSIRASQIPIGPPNVIARGIAFTEAGANGVPGANFFTIPAPVQYIVEGVTYTATALQINDNTSTTATFSFPDATLLAADAIDVQGNNLFDLIELGNPAWVRSYASRNFYGLSQNKLQNFLNLSFDGGYLPGGQLTPLGWTAPDSYGSLLVSPLFGNSYYIENSSGGTLGVAGLISQSAYEDSYLVPILLANTAYSVRICARAPSGLEVGELVLSLTANGVTYGTLAVSFTSLTDSFAIYGGSLLTNTLATIPSSLMLNLSAQGIENGADVEIDRIEIYPTVQPVYQTDIAASYANNDESIDNDTGYLDTSEDNAQPCYGAAIVLEQLILLKERSMYSTQDSPNYEPADWDVQPISQAVGTCGINAYDYGDEWLLTMVQSGVYGFNGGKPEPCSRELQLQNGPTPTQAKGLWESINWSAAQSFWLRNDIINRRFYCGVALPTPNFWLPNAPQNLNPQQPNVILMCNYEGCPTFDELISSTPVHTTIMGQLKALEQRRKWSIWQIPSPYAAMVKLGTGEQLTMLLCNGIASGKIYQLVPQQTTDDGTPIYPVYTTYGFVTATQGMQLQLGAGRKLATWWSGNVSGSGVAGLRFYPNTLLATYPQTNALALRLQNPAQNDDERKIEISGQRIFVEISGQGDGNGGGGYVECGRQTLEMSPHPWNAKRGIALGGGSS